MMNRKKLIILMVVMLAIIVAIFIIKVNYRPETNNDEHKDINTKTSHLSEKEKEELNNKIGNALGNKTDEEVLIVNGEKITEREIALCDFQLNNDTVNEDGEKKDVIDEIIKDYVICQDAQKLNISLTDEEMQDIKDVVKYDDDMPDLLKSLNMSYDEFCEMYINRRTKLDLKVKWATYIMKKINTGEINIPSELFNNKYTEYLETEDFSVKTQLLMELIDLYAEYLVEQANIEIID